MCVLRAWPLLVGPPYSIVEFACLGTQNPPTAALKLRSLGLPYRYGYSGEAHSIPTVQQGPFLSELASQATVGEFGMPSKTTAAQAYSPSPVIVSGNACQSLTASTAVEQTSVGGRLQSQRSLLHSPEPCSCSPSPCCSFTWFDMAHYSRPFGKPGREAQTTWTPAPKNRRCS